MKIVWFVVGGAFFLCWPVSSHYPKYRYLVSPFKWVLWDIPTNSEWSFMYLRRQAQITRERIIEKNVEKDYFQALANPAVRHTGLTTKVPKIKIEDRGSNNEDDGDDDDDDDDRSWYSACSSTSVLADSAIRSFRCQAHKVIGRLVIYSNGIRLVRSLPRPKKEIWRRDYIELAEMRKVEGSSAMSKLTSLSSDQLEIKFIDGSKVHFEGMKGGERDEVFNSIIAFSGLQWQSLQILSNNKAQP